MRRITPSLFLLCLAALSLAQTANPPEQPMLVLDANGHAASVRKVLFTPDGQQLVTVSQDKTIRIWDVASGETAQIFRLPIGPADQGAIYAAAMSSDGKSLAVGGMPYGAGRFGMLIHVLSMESGQVKRVMIGHSKIITALAFSPDGKQLASASNDMTARIHDVATGKLIHELKGHTDRLYNIAYSPDGKLVVTACRDKTGRIWSAATGKLVAELKAQDSPVMSLAFSPDGKTLAAGAADGSICLYDSNGKPGKIHSGLKNQLTSLSFTPDGKQLLYSGFGSAMASSAAGLVDVASGKEVVRFDKHNNTVMHGAVSPDGKLMATSGGNDHDTFIWRPSDGSVVQHLVGKGRSIYGVGWGVDGKTIAWGVINRGETQKGATPLQRTFRPDELDYGPRPDGKIRRAVISRGTRLLKEGPNSTMVVMENGKEALTFKVPLGAHESVYCFTMLADDRAAVGTVYGLYLVDLKTGQVLRRYRGHSGIVFGVTSSPDDRYFVSGSSDQTLRIWSVDKEEPLLSLFFAGDDWIAWTPQGYYAASANGERLMGWQVNKGVELPANYFPAVQFRRSLYRPDVIKHVMRLGSVEQAVAVAAKEQKAPMKTVNIGDVLPPTVTLVSPSTSGTTKQTTLEVKCKAASMGNYPVTAMRLLLDGRPYKGQAGLRTIAQPKLGEVQQDWTVDLTPGKHTLAVQAESGVSKGLSTFIEINCTSGKPQDQPNLYIFAAGINAYPADMRLNYCVPDAVALVKAFQEKEGKVFRKVEAKLLIDKQATKAEIGKGLAWLGSKMTPQDVGILYFSGHGDRDDKDDLYLLTADVNVDNIPGSCVSGEVVKRALGEMPGRLIAILDACHSGTAAEKPGRRPQRPLTDDFVRDLVTDDFGVIVMCSSLGKEYSLESPEIGHGFFTYALVEGLKGKADLNRDGAVFLNELDVYTTQRVQALTKGLQNPASARPGNIRPFVLAKP